jgi:excisionase family DNA binding protein
MQTHAHDKELLDIKQAATELGCHAATVRRAIHGGELEAVRLGRNGRYRVSRQAIATFLIPAVSVAPKEGP